MHLCLKTTKLKRPKSNKHISGKEICCWANFRQYRDRFYFVRQEPDRFTFIYITTDLIVTLFSVPPDNST